MGRSKLMEGRPQLRAAPYAASDGGFTITATHEVELRIASLQAAQALIAMKPGAVTKMTVAEAVAIVTIVAEQYERHLRGLVPDLSGLEMNAEPVE